MAKTSEAVKFGQVFKPASKRELMINSPISKLQKNIQSGVLTKRYPDNQNNIGKRS